MHTASGERRRFAVPAFWLTLITGTGSLVLYVWSLFVIAEFIHGTQSETGWTAVAEPGGDAYRVTQVLPESSVAVGDRIVAVNGVRVTSDLTPESLARPPHTGPGGYTLTIARGGNQAVVADLRYLLRADVRGGIASLLLALSSGVFILTGMVIGLMRPEERVATVATGFLLSEALAIIGVALKSVGAALTGAPLFLYLFTYSVNPLSFAVGLHFASIFPSGKMTRVLRALTALSYATAFILWLPRTAHNLLSLLPAESLGHVYTLGGSGVTSYLSHRPVFEGLFQLGTLLAVSFAVAHNYQYAMTPDFKRRIRWMGAVAMLYVAILAGFKIAEVTIVLVFDTPTLLESSTWLLVRQFTNLSLWLLPLAIGYTILKERLFDIHVALRLGLQYLLAKQVLRALTLTPLLLLILRLYSLRHRPLDETLLSGSTEFWIGIFVLAVVVLRFRTAAGKWLDRRFFRTNIASEELLLGIADLASAGDDLRSMAETAGSSIEESLSPKGSAIYLRDGISGAYHLYFSRGWDACNLAPSERLGVREGRPDFGILQPLLVLPVRGEGSQDAGWLVLREKKSEEPYTLFEQRLLEAVAAQLSLGYRQNSLQRSMAAELEIKAAVLGRLDKEIDLLKECLTCGACYSNSAEICGADQQALVHTLPVGRTLVQRYELLRRVGRGGFGYVYEATDLTLARRIAIKILPDDTFGDATSLRRFLREARASAALSHPNVVTVYDYGTIGQNAYLAMEFLDGGSLRAYLSACSPLTGETVLSWVNQLLAGVEAVHNAGIIHRDLKPENVMVVSSGQALGTIKLVDFGIAKLPAREALVTAIKTNGMIAGTIGYMAPEHMMGDEIDERSDLFAVGVLVFELLFGRKPFPGSTQQELYNSVMAGRIAPPESWEGRTARPVRWDCLAAILRKCLSRDAAERFGSVGELQAELLPALRASLEHAASGAHG